MCAVKVSHEEITTAKGLLAELRPAIPTDTEFAAAFGVARVSKDYLARYYLRAMELHLKGQQDPEWVPNEEVVINLEHVLPENPGENWPDVERDVAEAHYRRIGNSVLMQAKQNTLIGNSSFSVKRPVLRQSAYLLTQEVGAKKEWGIRQINERQQRLAEIAIQTWPLDV